MDFMLKPQETGCLRDDAQIAEATSAPLKFSDIVCWLSKGEGPLSDLCDLGKIRGKKIEFSGTPSLNLRQE